MSHSEMVWRGADEWEVKYVGTKDEIATVTRFVDSGPDLLAALESALLKLDTIAARGAGLPQSHKVRRRAAAAIARARGEAAS